MRTGMDPSYACLCVGYVEQSLFRSYTGTILVSSSATSMTVLAPPHAPMRSLNSSSTLLTPFVPVRKFTWNIFDTSLSFLDLSVSISGDHLEHDIYFKPVDSHSFLDYTSSYPPSCKNAIPYSQFFCLCCVCSQDGAFHSRTSQMSSYFKDRNISPS
eukprot:g21885.t1